MIKVSQKLSAGELTLLRQLIGQEFKYVGGPQVPDFLVSDYFVICCSASCISISGDSEVQRLADDSGEYSYLTLRSSTSEENDRALKSGNVFLLNLQNVISEVSIVSEEITKLKFGSPEWVYEADIAVILQMPSGAVIFELISHNAEAIAVKSTADFNVSSIDSPSSSFQDDLINSFKTKFVLAELGSTEED